ncbi:CoA-transferase [Caldisphaera sp.]|uniref:CoA-transferase n=1 Tax=Caldisphaera sp. TaxID=2060322 RepID=UPI003D0B7D82
MSSRPTDIMIKCMGNFIEDNDYVYHGLNSILPQLSMVYASLYLKKDFVWHSVSESFMPDPSQVKANFSTGDPYSEPNNIGFVSAIEGDDLVAKGKRDLMFFGAAQIDENANINLTVIGTYETPKVKLPGGAVLAYLYPLVKKMVIYAKHEPRVLVKKVDFITGYGKARLEKGLKTVLCTNKALIEFTKDGPMLKAVFPGVSISEVISLTSGMHININNKIDFLKPLNPEELKILNNTDPSGLRYEKGYE